MNFEQQFLWRINLSSSSTRASIIKIIFVRCFSECVLIANKLDFYKLANNFFYFSWKTCFSRVHHFWNASAIFHPFLSLFHLISNSYMHKRTWSTKVILKTSWFSQMSWVVKKLHKLVCPILQRRTGGNYERIKLWRHRNIQKRFITPVVYKLADKYLCVRI